MSVICNKMKIIDISDPERINRFPDRSLTIFSEENFSERGYKIKKVELRLFIEKNDEKLGPYSLITSLIDTDKGSIEMVYLEGYHGENPLERSKDFLVSSLGISSLILRSIIALESSSSSTTIALIRSFWFFELLINYVRQRMNKAACL